MTGMLLKRSEDLLKHDIERVPESIQYNRDYPE